MSQYNTVACIICNRELPATPEFFPRDRRFGTGLRPICIKCAMEQKPRRDMWNTALEVMRADNPKHNEYVKQYRKKHWRKYSHIRRARKASAEGSHTQAEIDSLYQQQQGRCYYCQCELNGKYHTDHFIPLSKGGSNDIGNIRLACASCNSSKGGKMPWEFGRLL